MIFRYYRDAAGRLQDGIVTPRQIDNRLEMPPILDQQDKPWCAAFSISQICEALLWKQYGLLVALDEEALYREAKLIDGTPYDGTTLEAALQAAFRLGCFDGVPKCEKIACSREAVKRGIHKFGFLFAGLNISERWNLGLADIPDGGKLIGGHAVVLCGYDDDGVIVQNSWGTSFGDRGFAMLSWPELQREFICAYGVSV